MTRDVQRATAPPRLLRALRAVSGAVAAGLVALAAAVGIAAAVAGERPGPGAGMLAGHLVVAASAVALQVVAQRRRGLSGVLAALAVIALAVAVLWLWWWS